MLRKLYSFFCRNKNFLLSLQDSYKVKGLNSNDILVVSGPTVDHPESFAGVGLGMPYKTSNLKWQSCFRVISILATITSKFPLTLTPSHCMTPYQIIKAVTS